ncbi:MAG: hypothetical protein ISS63_11995 [Desulfobacteraceae bacterium]|nr:hypothetical protein [Desulfobacteraceae bacterium]
MSNELKKDICFLCGHDSKSGSYNRGIGKAFIECINESCGEYLVTNTAMDKLKSDAEKRKEFSKMASSKKEIQDTRKIFVISYYGGIQADFKLLQDVLPENEISFFAFSSGSI